MKEVGLDKIKIDLYLMQPDIVQQTVDQIKKDFEMMGLELNYSPVNNGAYMELFQEILPNIEKYFNQNKSKLYALLYRIDLPENKIKKTLALNPGISATHLITDLIIKRELQKVVIRNQYKNKLR